MPSLRVGCDLCQISTMEQMLTGRDGSLERLFDPEEQRYARAHAQPAQHLAGVFAAKEALAKAVRQPKLLGKYHREVVVAHLEDGSPVLRLSDALSVALSGLGLRVLDCSISHDGGYAMATVLVTLINGAEPLQCRKCLRRLEALREQGITDALISVKGAAGTTEYLCPPCLRGW